MSEKNTIGNVAAAVVVIVVVGVNVAVDVAVGVTVALWQHGPRRAVNAQSEIGRATVCIARPKTERERKREKEVSKKSCRNRTKDTQGFWESSFAACVLCVYLAPLCRQLVYVPH